jgi:hypothetical protein
VRHQRLGGQAAVDRPLWRRCLHHRARAGAARIAWPAHHLHAQLGGNKVELLGPILADPVQRATAAGTVLALDVDHDVVAWQVSRQRAAIAVGGPCAPPPLGCLCRVPGRLALGGTLLRLLQAELELIEVKPLRARAIAVAQQTADQQPQFFVLGLQLRHHLPQHAPQDVRIVGKRREINLHSRRMIYARASRPMTHA